MKIPTPNGGGEFELAPAGTHLAVCYRFIDLGTQKTVYMGETNTRRKVLISWELCEEFMSDARPFTINQRYTWSMHEKSTLRKHLEAWRGKAFSDEDFGENGFDIRNILGRPCILTVTHTLKGEKVYANVSSVGRLMRGQQAAPSLNEQFYFSLDPAEFNADAWSRLPDWAKTMIMPTPEYAALNAQPKEPISDAPAHSDFNDYCEVPF